MPACVTLECTTTRVRAANKHYNNLKLCGPHREDCSLHVRTGEQGVKCGRLLHALSLVIVRSIFRTDVTRRCVWSKIFLLGLNF